MKCGVGLVGLFLLSAAHAAPRYVAMGSSYAAGPGITDVAPDGVPGCGQSADNYARQLARLRHLALTDVSCGGAVTGNILFSGQHGLPAQIDSVTRDTMLVTVTIGGNDVGFVGNLGAFSCQNTPERLPAAMRACRPVSLPRAQDWQDLRSHMNQIAQEVHRRAPAADLVFVDYVTILPRENRACDDLPLTPPQIATMRQIAARLAAITAETARDNHAKLLKASDLTRDHNVCAREPWSHGLPARAPAGYVPFHPALPAMTAIAATLDRTLP